QEPEDEVPAGQSVVEPDGTSSAASSDSGSDKSVGSTRGATVLAKAESILHAAKHYIRSRSLMWHYRSRHPKLIAFSNREFYGNQLLVFPLPDRGIGENGVHFPRIPDGIFDSHTNANEAKAVVNAVLSHALNHPDKSLLVAAMNRSQADLIDELLLHAE